MPGSAQSGATERTGTCHLGRTDGGFDLVHARLVLLHLPQRRRALQRMVRALRPGGWLVLGG